MTGMTIAMGLSAPHAGGGGATGCRLGRGRHEVAGAAPAPPLDAVASVARAALEEPDAWRGVALFLERSLDLQLADPALNAMLADPRLGGERARPARARIAALANALVRRGHIQGALRADVEGVDLVLLQRALAAVVDGTGGGDPARCRRFLAACVDTVRAGGASR
jgi:hypothetical protein